MRWWLMFYTVINISLIYVIYLYLDNLRMCSCVNQEITTKLKETEYTIFKLIIVSSLLLILNSMFGMTSSSNKTIKYGMISAYIVLYIVSLYTNVQFIYNTFKFQKTLKYPCECAEKWEKYVIYINAVLYTLSIILTFITLLFMCWIVSTGKMNFAVLKKILQDSLII